MVAGGDPSPARRTPGIVVRQAGCPGGAREAHAARIRFLAAGAPLARIPPPSRPRLAGHHLPHDEEANPIRAARPSMIVINIAYPLPSLDPREKLHSLFPRPSG